jgi:ATP-dependent RNA helicase DeaD
MAEQDEQDLSFRDLNLSEALLQTLAQVGYEVPTPIQARTIPALLEGRDLIGQAQTGTGKTAAFALPLLQRVAPSRREPQALILAPTRELSLQVAEAIHVYSRGLGGIDVLPLYGGQPIQVQLRRLSRGVHVVVGTPGRILDHLRRGSLRLDTVRFVVLDEADEMLRMGFLEDVEAILSQAPHERQTALFSATMPPEIKRVAKRHLRDPLSLATEQRAVTVPAIEQRYLNVAEKHKIEALTRLLEVEESAAVLVFVRTKTGAADLTEKLGARGYAAEALHGDLTQPQREAVLRRLRAGDAEIVVATDVAARGLDVEHISHVIQYDIPNDVEAYVHRIGRTGRAGRAGVAVLFVTPRERRMMRDIERFTGKALRAMKMPTGADVAARRAAAFKEMLQKAVVAGDLDLYVALVEEVAEEGGHDMAEVAAAAARLASGGKPLELALEPLSSEPAEGGMIRLFIGAGSRAGVRPGDVVGALANEGGIPGPQIGSIDIYEDFALVEIPREYEEQVLSRMRRAKLRGRPMEIRVAPGAKGGRPARRKEVAPRRRPRPS